MTGISTGGSSVWNASGSNIYYNSGKVGIGTSNPGGTVHISCTNPGPHLQITSNQATMLRMKSTASGGGHYRFWVSANANSEVGNKFLLYDETAGVHRWVVDGSGNVGIGTTSPSYKLHVNGTAAGTSWTNLSSREYKENIKKVNENQHADMLKRLLKMDLATYKYKEEFGGDGDTKLGFIAEEMPKEVLSKDGKGVDVYELLSYSIGAIKAQQNEIKAQKDEIKTLKAQLNNSKALEERLAKVETLLNK